MPYKLESIPPQHGVNAFGDMQAQSLFALDPATPFIISGMPITRDALVIQTGIDLDLNQRLSIWIIYNRQLSKKSREKNLKGLVTIKF